MGNLFAHMSDFKHATSVLTPPSMIKLLHATAPPIFPYYSQLDLLVHMMDRSCDMMPNCVSMLAELANIPGGNCSISAFTLRNPSRAATAAGDATYMTRNAAAASA